VLVRDTPQSVHRPRGPAAGANSGAMIAGCCSFKVMVPATLPLCLPAWARYHIFSGAP